MKHLRYQYLIAIQAEHENRHAQEVMKELGITYQYSTPQSIGDQWWFWNCENIPKELPNYITFLDINPMEYIGYGLSEKTAKEICDYESNK